MTTAYIWIQLTFGWLHATPSVSAGPLLWVDHNDGGHMTIEPITVSYGEELEIETRIESFLRLP